MSVNPSQPLDPVQQMILEGKRVDEDATFCYAGHSEEARWWNRVTGWLGIPSALIAAAAGVLSVSSQESSYEILGSPLSVAAGILAFLVAAVTGLSTFLDPKGQASKHYQACVHYLKLRSDSRVFYTIECTTKSAQVDELEKTLRLLVSRLNELNSQTPMISERSRRLAARNVDSGRYTYGVDKPS